MRTLPVLLALVAMASCSGSLQFAGCKPVFIARAKPVKPDTRQRPAGRIPDHTYMASIKCPVNE